MEEGKVLDAAQEACEQEKKRRNVMAKVVTKKAKRRALEDLDQFLQEIQDNFNSVMEQMDRMLMPPPLHPAPKRR